MAIWNVLEIEETNDIKSIKRAYAKKIKVVRPDENPKEFQELHFAYKQAVYQAKQNSIVDIAIVKEPSYEENFNIELDDNNFLQSTENDNKIEEKMSLEAAIPLGNSKTFNEENLIFSENKRLVEWVKKLVEDDSFRHRFDLWQKIAESKYLLEPEFNYDLGIEIFRIIAEHNSLNRTKRKKYNRIEPKMLHYLDGLFNWNINESDIRYEFGDKLCNVIFIKLPQSNDNSDDSRAIAGLMGGANVKKIVSFRESPIDYFYFAGNLKRFFAFIFDLIICNIFTHLIFQIYTKMINNVTNKVEGDFLLYGTLLVYYVTSYFLEVSKFQATFGKLIFGLKLTTTENTRVSYFRGLIRLVSFAILSIGNYITLLINSWLGPKYMHDRISRTQVIDMRLSRKEHDKKQKWRNSQT